MSGYKVPFSSSQTYTPPSGRQWFLNETRTLSLQSSTSQKHAREAPSSSKSFTPPEPSPRRDHGKTGSPNAVSKGIYQKQSPHFICRPKILTKSGRFPSSLFPEGRHEDQNSHKPGSLSRDATGYGANVQESCNGKKAVNPNDMTMYGCHQQVGSNADGHGQLITSEEESFSRILTAKTASDSSDTAEWPIPAIAMDLARTSGTAKPVESETFILTLEECLQELRSQPAPFRNIGQLSALITESFPKSHGLLFVNESGDYAEEGVEGDGGEAIQSTNPYDRDPDSKKAAFTAIALLSICYPILNVELELASPEQRRRLPSVSEGSQLIETTLPRLLLNWLNQFHNPYEDLLEELLESNMEPAVRSDFWDIVFSSLLRGKLAEVTAIFQKISHSNLDFSDDKEFYGRNHTQSSPSISTKNAISRMIETLDDCQRFLWQDSTSRPESWALFRGRASDTYKELLSLAEGGSTGDSAFPLDKFGLHASPSTSVRRNDSSGVGIPWSLYQNLRTLYSILMGDASAIINFSQDWVEATIFLAIWWHDDQQHQISQSRSKIGQITSRPSSEPDSPAYANAATTNRHRLIDALRKASGTGAFQIDTNNIVELGLACALSFNITCAVALIRSWSLSIASAVAEAFSWLNRYGINLHQQSFAENNKFGCFAISGIEIDGVVNKDDIILEYADSFRNRTFSHLEGLRACEGWEFAIQVLSRLDDRLLSRERIRAIVKESNIESEDHANKLIHKSRTYGLGDEADRIAERYGDLVAKTSNNYGLAMVYFARSRHWEKLKGVLDALIFMSLAKSSAFPSLPNLDDRLSELISHPRLSFEHLLAGDRQAAELMAVCLSGYGTLRRFYELRDCVKSSENGLLQRTTREEEMAKTLMTIIASSSSCISGGIFDKDCFSVVPVEAIFPLLGEVTALLNHNHKILSLQQMLFLLRVIENIQTAHYSVRRRCSKHLNAIFTASRESERSAFEAFQRRPISKLTSKEFVVAFTDLAEGNVRKADSHSASRLGIDTEGGWDWIKEFRHGLTCDNLIMTLRAQLAWEISLSWPEMRF